jgi:hypothetical protein
VQTNNQIIYTIYTSYKQINCVKKKEKKVKMRKGEVKRRKGEKE